MVNLFEIAVHNATFDEAAIRRRWEAFGIDNAGTDPAAIGWNGAAHASAGDVPALLREIERLRFLLSEVSR